MKKAIAVLASLAMCLCFLSTAAFAATGINYVVTFSPGEHGGFTQAYADSLTNTYGAANVAVSAATGSISVRVPEGTKLSAPSGVVIKAGHTNYYFKGVTDAAGNTYDLDSAGVSGDASYIVSYGVLLQGQTVDYTVVYLDRDTNAEVAPSITGQANVGDRFTMSAPAVANYTAVSASQVLDLTGTAAGSTATLTFYYTFTGNSTVTTTETVYETTTTTVVAGGGAGAGAGGAGAGGAAAGGETIPENNTPEGGASSSVSSSTAASSQSGETIGDNSTPEGAASTAGNGSFSGTTAAGISIAAVLAMGLFLLYMKKRSSHSQEK